MLWLAYRIHDNSPWLPGNLVDSCSLLPIFCLNFHDFFQLLIFVSWIKNFWVIRCGLVWALHLAQSQKRSPCMETETSMLWLKSRVLEVNFYFYYRRHVSFFLPCNFRFPPAGINSNQSVGFPCSEGKIRIIFFEIFYSILIFLTIEINIRTLKFSVLMVMDDKIGLIFF